MRVSSGYTCPIIFCTEVGPHEHEICDGCGAMEHGNVFCNACRAHWESLELCETSKLFNSIQESFAKNVQEVIAVEQNVQD